MNGNEVGLPEHCVQIGGFDAVIQMQGALYGEVRIVAEHFHSEIGRGVGNEYADGAQTDHAESFSEDLMPDKF